MIKSGSNKNEVINHPPGMQFPCIIDIKIFLKFQPNNKELVHDVLLQSVATENLLGVKTKQSTKGKYQSFSCRINAQSKQEMDHLFEKLTAHPEVVMVI